MNIDYRIKKIFLQPDTRKNNNKKFSDLLKDTYFAKKS